MSENQQNKALNEEDKEFDEDIPSEQSLIKKEGSGPGKDAGSPASKTTRPAMQKLTVEEAANEIRRLRRIVHELRADLTAAVEARERDTTKAREHFDAAEIDWRENNNRLTTRIQELEAKLTKAEKHAEEAEEQMRYLQATSLPITDARKLTYKALRKGRALQCLADLVSQNSYTNRMLREGFTALLSNAFGATHVAFRMQQQRIPGGITAATAVGAVAAANDQQLRLLRQEQLLLLVENERLTKQVAQLQLEMAPPAQVQATPSPRSAMQRSPRAWTSDAAIPPDSRATSAFGPPSEPYGRKMDWRLAAPGARRALAAAGVAFPRDHLLALEFIPAVFRSAQKRILSWAFRKLYTYGLFATEQLRVEAEEKRDRYRQSGRNVALGLRFLHFAIRISVQRCALRALWKLFCQSRCAALQKKQAIAEAAAAERRRSGILKREEQQQQRLSVCPDCARRSYISGPGGSSAETSASPFVQFPRAPAAISGTGGILPYVCQPYYYKTLPSMQRRNLYFAAPAPPVQQETLRAQALRQSPILRPEPSGAGVPSRTFGAVEAESALLSGHPLPHAVFDADLQRRNRLLHHEMYRSQA